MGDRHDAITCVIGLLCPHQHRTKVDGLGGFLLAYLLAILHGRGNGRRWHCSRCVVGCGRWCSRSSNLLPLLLCPCGGRRNYGGEGRGHDDDLDLIAGRLRNVRHW